jgi:hypothetical protein
VFLILVATTTLLPWGPLWGGNSVYYVKERATIMEPDICPPFWTPWDCVSLRFLSCICLLTKKTAEFCCSPSNEVLRIIYYFVALLRSVPHLPINVPFSPSPSLLQYEQSKWTLIQCIIHPTFCLSVLRLALFGYTVLDFVTSLRALYDIYVYMCIYILYRAWKKDETSDCILPVVVVQNVPSVIRTVRLLHVLEYELKCTLTLGHEVFACFLNFLLYSYMYILDIKFLCSEKEDGDGRQTYIFYMYVRLLYSTVCMYLLLKYKCPLSLGWPPAWLEMTKN